ncbi:hypothetical protein CPB85DRAFT_1254979 [Mucidula mucida]|nr:hypothetical protein CPB85DRAFT_1254979 [Mucidula mucida]
MSSQSSPTQAFPQALLPPTDLRSMGFRFSTNSVLSTISDIRTIPSPLVPRLGFSYAPPKLNYGWSMNDDEVLSALEANRPDFIVNTMAYDFLNDESEEQYDPDATMDRIYEYMTDELHLSPTWRPRMEEKIEMNDPEMRCVSIANNYENGVELPPDEVVQALVDFFKFDQEPRWFLNLHHSGWRRRLLRMHEGELIIQTKF